MPSRDKTSVLWLPGVGGPGAAYAANQIGDRCAVTFLYDPDQLNSRERDESAMRASGRAEPYDDHDQAVKIAARLHADDPFDAVVTYSEGPILLLARLVEELGLRGHTTATARLLTDKPAQRTALTHAGVPVPRHVFVDSPHQLRHAAREVGFPAVLKPARGGGSRLTFAVDTLAEVLDAWHLAEAGYADEHGTPTTLFATGHPEMLLEGRLVGGGTWHTGPHAHHLGDYVSVDTAAFDGTYRHLMTKDKLPLADGFREAGHLAPTTLTPEALTAVHEMTERGLRALGVTDGVCLTEIKLTEDGPRIIEINGRPGGSTMVMLQPWGYNLVLELVHQAAGHGLAPAPVPGPATGLLIPSLGHDLADTDLTLTWSVDPAALQGVTEFHDLAVTRFDRGGGGIAALAYAVAPTVADLITLNDQIRAAMRIDTTADAPHGLQ